MIFLNPPLENKSADDIFEKCISDYKNKERVKRLYACKPLVAADEEKYNNYVPQKIDCFSASELPNGIKSRELSNLYDEKFAKNGSVGREYYDAIISQAVRGICPICGVQIASTLDHYLPKSKAPTLAVTPSNLIPACRDCNTNKKTDMVLKPDSTPVHLYFDRIPNDFWLHTELGDNMEVKYYAQCPEYWEEALRARVEKHLDFYKLHKLYSAHAAQDIESNKLMWLKILTVASPEALRAAIIDTKESAEENDLNSWRSALYRGLADNFEAFLNWLKADQRFPASPST